MMGANRFKSRVTKAETAWPKPLPPSAWSTISASTSPQRMVRVHNLRTSSSCSRSSTWASGRVGRTSSPSNISGLPTWYIIRASDHHYQAPGDRTHIRVLVNPKTWMQDLEEAEEGSAILGNSDAKMPMERQDVIFYPVPMTSLARTINPKLTRLITNMIYVGALAELLAIDDVILKRAVARQFNGKASAIELNSRALDLGRDHVREHLEKQDPYTVEARDGNDGAFFLEGNEAVALGSIMAFQMMAWYLDHTLILPCGGGHRLDAIPSYDAEGHPTYAIVRARRDELAAAGTIIGAGWAGAVR